MIAVTEDVGGEDAVDVGRGGIGGLGEGDGNRRFRGCGTRISAIETRLVGEAEDFEGGQAELAAGGDGEGLEEVEVFEGVVGVEGDEFGPVVAAGSR